ncbi:TonB-dependent receptor plug domain-containing protein [Psychroserpens ponticola]|uniref:TonB-dependent receptor plug domain-containing protein n=1 Tax=Psychroserpens ponticola TaxID=2932268 RepID=A0ABY7RVA1_9FLAO|nr:TonB-dependent receptor plug domain-containing protein [Psychroserpens ponticola]WCO00620.1 TonB-dependent receptor plug domain-containing protein [Psychroserpens ponticola]
MEIKNKLYVLCFILFLFSFGINAQETSSKLLLIEVFVTLQKQYNIQFNFAEDSLEGITIVPPTKELSLEDVLLYLERNTLFSFKNLDGTFILVRSKSKTFELQHLSEVILSKYIIKGINKLKNGSYEIDFTQFDILPGLIDTDVLQAVQAFPGIQSINETVSDINIRAGTHDQNLILWDGIKMYQSGHFFGLISMFNPQITHQVNVVKNGTDVSLTDGVSGTISMETSSNINTEFKGSLGVNFIDANGFTDVPLSEKSSLQVAARKSISDFFETPTYTNFFNRISQDTEVEMNANDIINSNQEFDFYDTSLRWIYDISDKDQLRVNFLNTYNELRFNENSIINQLETSRQSSLSQHSIAGAIQYNRIWNDKWQSGFEVYETDYKLKAINANIIDQQRFQQENIVSETSIKFRANYKVNENIQLLNGYHFVETKITNLDDVDNPRFKSLVSEVLTTHGLFTQLKYKTLDNNTNLNFGLRYNYLGKFSKHILEPRFALTHQFLDDFSLDVLGEFKHQNTSQVINFQNDFLGIEKRRWQLSNDTDIPVIRSKQISVGLSYNKKGWLVNLEGYYKYVNGITTQSQGFQNQYEFVKRIGNYDAKGLDFILRKEIQKLNTWLSYSFMKSNYEFSSLSEQMFPSNFDVKHTVTFGAVYALERLKLSAGFNWHLGKPTTQPISGKEIVNDDINYEITNSSNLEDYLRVDISMLYDFKLGKTKADLGVSIWNVFDKTNEINKFYRVNNGMVNVTLQNSLGFTPNAVLRIHF